MMDVKKKIQILRACSRKKGERCSSCPAFGQGSRNCMKNTMKDAADALEKLQAELEQVKAERDAAIECLKNKCPFCRKYLTCQGRTINNDCWEFFGLKED